MKKSLDLGNISITWLNGGEFELDGGTMFGPVPKLLWNKKYPSDHDNNIKMLNAPLLIETPLSKVLIDTGLGNKLSDKEIDIFRVTKPWSVVADLAAMGIDREDIDYVILTHCDFDHAGGIVMHSDQGKPELTFPKARHIVQKKEWEDVTHPNSRAAHSYWPHNFTGLEASGLLEIIEGDHEVVPGITVSLTGGHTRGHQIATIAGKKECAVHLGDLLPLHSHFNPLWIMAYDNFPLDIIEQKEKILPFYASQNYWFTFYHDIYMKACQFDSFGSTKATWHD